MPCTNLICFMFCSVLLFATCYTFWPERKVVSCCIFLFSFFFFFSVAIYFSFLVFSTLSQHYWLFCFLHHCSASLQSSQTTGASIQTGKPVDLTFWDLFIKATEFFFDSIKICLHISCWILFHTLHFMLYHITRLLIYLYTPSILIILHFWKQSKKEILGTEMSDSPCL